MKSNLILRKRTRHPQGIVLDNYSMHSIGTLEVTFVWHSGQKYVKFKSGQHDKKSHWLWKYITRIQNCVDNVFYIDRKKLSVSCKLPLSSVFSWHDLVKCILFCRTLWKWPIFTIFFCHLCRSPSLTTALK